MLTHKFFKQTRKYKQNEDPSVTTSKGFLAFKIGFKKIKAGPQLLKQEPHKLICYGNLPS